MSFGVLIQSRSNIYPNAPNYVILEMSVDGILHAQPDDEENLVVLLLEMVSENLRNLLTLKIGTIWKASKALHRDSQTNLESCILKYRSSLQRTRLPDVRTGNKLFYTVEAGDGLARYVGTWGH